MFTEAVSLRIFLGDDTVSGEHAVHDRIVQRAQQEGLAGATVVRGLRSYGQATRSMVPLLPTADRPVIIEVIDTEAKIRSFLSVLAEFPEIRLVTQQPISVLKPLESTTRSAS